MLKTLVPGVSRAGFIILLLCKKGQAVVQRSWKSAERQSGSKRSAAEVTQFEPFCYTIFTQKNNQTSLKT